jgi:hypothetical protein
MPINTAAHNSQQRQCYPWLRLHVSGAQRAAGLMALVTGIALAFLYSRYLQGNDAAPDSVSGLGFAVAGTLLLLLVGAGYTLRKRWGGSRAARARVRKTGFRRRLFPQGARWPGLLHTFLAWHAAGGFLGLLLIWMHTAGNFGQPSGTYAFFGLLGIVASGLTGRLLDYVCPRLAALAALQALNARGEDRLEALTHRFERVQPRRAQAMQAARSEANAIQAAVRRERFFLRLIRLWRFAHIFISLVAVALVLWHLLFALNWLLMGY